MVFSVFNELKLTAGEMERPKVATERVILSEAEQQAAAARL